MTRNAVIPVTAHGEQIYRGTHATPTDPTLAVHGSMAMALFSSTVGKQEKHDMSESPRTSAKCCGEFAPDRNRGVVCRNSRLCCGSRSSPLSSTQTVMTLQDTPDDESHDRFPLPRPLPREGGGEIREPLTTSIVRALSLPSRRCCLTIRRSARRSSKRLTVSYRLSARPRAYEPSASPKLGNS